MDVRKRLPRLNSRLILTILLVIVATVFGFSVYAYQFARNIKDPKSCFITSMNKVHLCPSDENYVNYGQVPKIFYRALIISEDAGFYGHDGLDWHEIKESLETNWQKGSYARGASTLTQQLAKNLYLSKEKSLTRKFKEFFVARRIEERLTKTQILEKYVNVVEFGKNIFGLKKASSHYFGKRVSELNLLESVYLVSLLPNPKKLGASHKVGQLSESNVWRMQVILKRLYNTKRISDEVYVYSEMLVEDQPWPFPHFHADMDFTESPPTPPAEELVEEFSNIENDGLEADSTTEESNQVDADTITDATSQTETELEPSAEKATTQDSDDEHTP